MIKLIIGIVLLILILIAANYIFVEKEHFQVSDNGSSYGEFVDGQSDGSQEGCTDNDIAAFLGGQVPSDNSGRSIANSCCPKILSDSNDIKKMLYEFSQENFQENHLKIMSYCNKLINEGEKVPLIERDCSKINKEEDIMSRALLCQINDKCMLKDEAVGMCKDKCPESFMEDGDTCNSPCVTNQVDDFKYDCNNYYNPIDCNNASIEKENGDNINVCSWNQNEFGCQSRCNELSQEKCNELEFCSFSDSTCEEKTCDLSGMDDYCENKTYCGKETLSAPTCHVRSEDNCGEDIFCEFDTNFIQPICTNRV
jgi:hypothetical protein